MNMSRRGLLGSSLAALVGGCDDSRVVQYNYRLKVVASVDGVERTGSSVIRVRWREGTGVYGGDQFQATIWGEAPFIDMGGERGLLFAPLTKSELAGDFLYPAYVFPRIAVGFFDLPNKQRLDALKRMPGLANEFVLPRNEWPIFVRFRDPRIPSTVEEVHRESMNAPYGFGAGISRVSMQVTQDAPTQAIEAVLPWVTSLQTNLAGERERLAAGAVAHRFGSIEFRMWNLTF